MPEQRFREGLLQDCVKDEINQIILPFTERNALKYQYCPSIYQ